MLHDTSFNARCLLELLEMMLDDISWNDESWSPERTLVFRTKYEGVFAAVKPRIDVATAPPVVLAKYMREVEVGLKKSRDHVLWVVASFLPNHRPEDGDDVFWSSLLC